MEVISIARANTLGYYLASEYSSDYCRDTATLLAGAGADRVVPRYTVLGMITIGALAASAAAFATGNTGNGTSSAPAVLAKAKPGDYVATFLTATRFEVEDPEGAVVGTGSVGTAFAKQVGFTLTAGGTAFAAGDGVTFTVTSALASEKYVPLDWAASDGTQTPRAVLLFDATAPNGADNDMITVLSRGPVLAAAEQLVWPAGSTAAQIATGLRLLRDRGLVHRITG